MNFGSVILQIIPRLPGTHDGVGDYAIKLAERLSDGYGQESIFAVAAPTFASQVRNFRIVALPDTVSEDRWQEQNGTNVILHYVNYGYQNRGVPFRLPSIVRRLHRAPDAKLIVIFHELYASGPPWQSAFWLRPFQKSLARSIAELSDNCVVSSETMRDTLKVLAPEASVSVHPVVSTIGEPNFSAGVFLNRDPHKWVVFGGTHLVERSLRSLRDRISRIPPACSPNKLFVLGGAENKAVGAELDQLKDIECQYFPAIEATTASEILSSCAFGWIDYFRQQDVPTDAILKSGSFASYCAHGVIPVLPHDGSAIAIRSERLPGPYFVEANRASLPPASERPKIAAEIHQWYRRNAAVEHLAKAIAAALETKPSSFARREKT